MADSTGFNWSNVINPAVSAGSNILGTVIGNALNPQTQLSKEQQAFQQQLALYGLKQQKQTRGAALPGQYQTLGYSPDEAATMAKAYKDTPLPAETVGGGGSADSSGGGLGSKVASTALGIGTGVAAPLIAHALGAGTAAATTAGTAGAATTGGLGSTIAGFATNPFTIAGAGILAGALLWKKSQVHPTADKWVQGEQNPFDASMSNIDKQTQAGTLTGEQAQSAKMQNAQNYLQELQKFSQQGSHENIVARQAAATFRQYYGDPSQYGINLGF